MTLNVTIYPGETTKLSEGHKFAARLQDVHKRLATFPTIYECSNEFINVKFKRLRNVKDVDIRNLRTRSKYSFVFVTLFDFERLRVCIFSSDNSSLIVVYIQLEDLC